MGAKISSETLIEENTYLRRFVGLQPISDNDPFWNHFLSFNFLIDSNNRKEVEQFDISLSDSLQSLMYNTPTTCNFASFIHVLLRRTAELKASEIYNNTIFLWQTGNALIILRHICKFLVQRLSETEFIKVFHMDKTYLGKKDAYDSDFEEEFDGLCENKAEELLDTLVDILVDLPSNDSTETIHIEAVKCLMVLLSSQLYDDDVMKSNIFYRYLMQGKCSTRSLELSLALISNYLQRYTPCAVKHDREPESIVLGLAASVWSAVQIVTGMDDSNSLSNDSEIIPPVSLGSLSVLLLLNLACHQDPEAKLNPYKESLSKFQNSQEVSSLNNSETGTFKLDYSLLYERLCATVNQQSPMLFLYILLHRNVGFRNYILSRINLEKLVLPVLIVLSDGAQSSGMINSYNAHHVYLALIVILILSEDDFFCKVAHETMIKNTTWFNSERPLGEISLGGLIILVFVRIIQLNTLKTKDRYLHTNCLAALANMSSYFKNLPSVVCQKLIGLLEVFTRRHAKLIENMRVRAEYDIIQEKESHNYHKDITALEEGIRTLLEICNSCLSSNLRSNPHFIYTILYKRDLFDAFQNHPMFQDLIWNICAVINHFASRVQLLERGSSVSAILATIQKGVLHWPTDRLKKFPELKFKYVEDDNTVEFFVPYVWRLTFQFSTLYWDATRIRLFNTSFLT
uniref:Dymeclin n=1 Tax=Brugia malayi TaxID=6279 RepID=A0A0I9N5D8_BRUMA|nr:Bm2811 [Brugia malayi]